METTAQSPGPAWDAFVKADQGIKDYTETLTTHEVLGNRTEDRVYHFSYAKPSYARSEIISGPGAGGAAVWHGGDKVKGHQGGFLAGIKLVISENDPRATDLRGKTIEAAFFPWMIAGFEKSGKLSEAPGPTIDGVETDAVTLIPDDPAKERNLTKETILLSRTTHLPVQHLGYEGDKLVEQETFSEEKINVGLPKETFEM
jgi:outer membrane lipoprotein-sorting protein